MYLYLLRSASKLGATILLLLAPLFLLSQSYQNLFESPADLSVWKNSALGGFSVSPTSNSKIDGLASLRSTATSNPRSISLQFLPLATQADFDGQNWEWSFVYKNNLTMPPQHTLVYPDAGIKASDTHAWRFWLVSNMDDVQNPATTGYYVTHSNGKIELRYRYSEWYTAILASTTFSLTSGSPYVIRVARIISGTNIIWRLYVDPFISTRRTATTLIGEAYHAEAPRVYNRSTLVSMNASAYTGAFSWDNIYMFRRNVTLTDANTTTNGISSGPLRYGMNNQVLFGFGINITGTLTLNSLNLVNPGHTSNAGYFGNARLYRSSDAVFSADDIPIGTVNLFGAYVNVTGLNEAYNNLGGSAVYYFLVADFNQSWGGTPGTIQFKIETGQTPEAIIQEAPERWTYNHANIQGNMFQLATTRHWRGWVSSDWQNPANWTGNAVPGPNDFVCIGEQEITNPPVISSDATLSGITLGNIYPVTLTINSGATLTILSDITQENAANSTINNSIIGKGSIIASHLRIGNDVPPTSNQSTTLTAQIGKLVINRSVLLHTAKNGALSNVAKFNNQSGKLLVKGQ